MRRESKAGVLTSEVEDGRERPRAPVRGGGGAGGTGSELS